MAQRLTLFAILVAIASGYAAVRQGRMMAREGVDLSDGGGWTVLFLVEFTTCFAAVGVALS
jgi:hypothetical protein